MFLVRVGKNHLLPAAMSCGSGAIREFDDFTHVVIRI